MAGHLDSPERQPAVEWRENPWEWLALSPRPHPVRLHKRLTAAARPHFFVWVCNAGRALVRLLGRETQVTPGTILLLPPGIAVAELRRERATDVVEAGFDLRWRGRLIQDARPHIRLTTPAPTLALPGMPEFSLWTALKVGSMGDRLLQAAHIFPDPVLCQMELVAQIHRCLVLLRGAQVSGVGQFGTAVFPALRAARYLYRQVDNPAASLTTLAQHLGLSRTHTARLFREEYQTSPMRFLHEQRMMRARRLLEQSELRIGEIAGHCGFNSAAHFCRVFKVEYGQSPREFRKQWLGQVR